MLGPFELSLWQVLRDKVDMAPVGSTGPGSYAGHTGNLETPGRK